MGKKEETDKVLELALSLCGGSRQESLVRALVNGPVLAQIGGYGWEIGDPALTRSSYLGLRKRLMAAGFTVGESALTVWLTPPGIFVGGIEDQKDLRIAELERKYDEILECDWLKQHDEDLIAGLCDDIVERVGTCHCGEWEPEQDCPVHGEDEARYYLGMFNSLVEEIRSDKLGDDYIAADDPEAPF